MSLNSITTKARGIANVQKAKKTQATATTIFSIAPKSQEVATYNMFPSGSQLAISVSAKNANIHHIIVMIVSVNFSVFVFTIGVSMYEFGLNLGAMTTVIVELDNNGRDPARDGTVLLKNYQGNTIQMIRFLCVFHNGIFSPISVTNLSIDPLRVWTRCPHPLNLPQQHLRISAHMEDPAAHLPPIVDRIPPFLRCLVLGPILVILPALDFQHQGQIIMDTHQIIRLVGN